MRVLSYIGLGLLLLPVAACTSAVDATEDDATSTTYYEMTSRLSAADLARWETFSGALKKSFDNVCGDTYCSGDYSNLTTVGLVCSITQSSYVKECNWTLGGSIEYVDGATGAFTIDARIFPCTIPVKMKFDDFMNALDDGGDQSIKWDLPGTGQSFYDGIGACLSGVVGNLPPPNTGSTYLELADYNDNWIWRRRDLDTAFDKVCEGTYCEGKYKNIAPLRAACAVNTTTGDVTGCRWSFAAANFSVTKKGKVSASTKLFKCPISVKENAATFLQSLEVTDPLSVKLPPSNATIFDQLGSCL
jgi:hypothetical protein